MRGRKKNEHELPGELQKKTIEAGNIIARSASASLVLQRFILFADLKQLTHFIFYISLFSDHYVNVVTNELSYQINKQTWL